MAQTRSKVLGNILEWYGMIKDPKLSYQNISNIFQDNKCVKIFSSYLCSIIIAMFGLALFVPKVCNLLPV